MLTPRGGSDGLTGAPGEARCSTTASMGNWPDHVGRTTAPPRPERPSLKTTATREAQAGPTGSLPQLGGCAWRCEQRSGGPGWELISFGSAGSCFLIPVYTLPSYAERKPRLQGSLDTVTTPAQGRPRTPRALLLSDHIPFSSVCTEPTLGQALPRERPSGLRSPWWVVAGPLILDSHT